jgi:hypothetical protein
MALDSETGGDMVQGSRRPSPALVISFIALLVAISGTASALPGRNQVKKDDIAANAVRSSDIKAKNVRSSDIAPGAVGGSDLAAGSVGSNQIANGSIGNGDLAPAVANELLPSGSRVTMSAGQAPRTLLDNGTFKLVAECTADADARLASVFIETTQANSALNNFLFLHDSVPAGEEPGDESGQFEFAFGPGRAPEPIVSAFTIAEQMHSAMYMAIAPNGASLSGMAAAGILMQGADCLFTAFGVS